MLLTRDNYYTQEADWEYMSCSQYQSFCECEAAAMAKLEGRWKGPDTDAFLVGNYFHSYMEGPEAHNEFCQQYFDKIYKTKTDKKSGLVEITGKYAAYDAADRMIEKCLSDPMVRQFYEMPGNVEEIMTGELFGIPWRIRMDKRVPSRNLILDWKTTANIRELKFNPITRERETFAEAYGYLMRAAVYSEIMKQNEQQDYDPQFLIVAVSKQDPSDLAVLSLNHRQRWDLELEDIKKRLPHIIRVKTYQEQAKRCGECDYCRATSRVRRIIPYYELKPEFREGYDYDEFPENTPAVQSEDGQLLLR
ncbi:MAG TPA: PD-(D/E)XK nuclease-like domain-containing protein [Firmicutes bacterium]|nr:PD-(D/E)XK nuclease-like domain-containing protein [Bacillota bacterium]